MTSTIINEVEIEKLVTVIGTKVGENETKQLHTSTCPCGKTMVRANKRESLNHYTENEKWTAKCCKGMLTYTGEKFFKGKELFIELPVISIPELANEVVNEVMNEVEVEEEVEEVKLKKVSKVKREKTGMTNTKIVAMMIENVDNIEGLTTLFNENEELFIKMVQCIKDEFKFKVLPVIQVKYPSATIQSKNPKVKHVVL